MINIWETCSILGYDYNAILTKNYVFSKKGSQYKIHMAKQSIKCFFYTTMYMIIVIVKYFASAVASKNLKGSHDVSYAF